MTYIELHACSAFSFLEGASNPEALVQEAVRFGYPALGLLDRDGVYGAPRFYRACRGAGIRSIVGAELTTPDGRLPVLVESRTGYQNLCRLITSTKLRSEKGAGITSLDDAADAASGTICLTGGRDGALACLLRRDRDEARAWLDRLQHLWGPDQVYVELQRHFARDQEALNQGLVELARVQKAPLVATNGVRHAAASGRVLHDVLTCIHHKITLDKAGRLLNRNADRHLKSPEEMRRIFADLPEAVENTVSLAARLDFTLSDLGYRFPDYPVPAGETMVSYLRKVTHAGARQRYRPYHEKARRQIEYELNMIEKLDLAGYFLIVWDIVRFCRENDILAQGRGSAANSAVCYSLGITAVDPVGMDLLFERFLSEERGEWPDIDLDLPSGDRRERVIQHVYERYGRRGAAMTANVITYRGRSAAREVGKVFGFPPETLDRLSKLLVTWGETGLHDESLLLHRIREAGLQIGSRRTRQFARIWREIQNLPRHLGQHTGGMIICQGRLDSVVPLEPARMPDRTVVQWDKDDCADLGIIKVDLLGLGMMAAIHEALELVRSSGRQIDLAHLPQDDPKVYAMLQAADTVGVFQVESRAQMATLPRLKPRCFYDLVVEVAIIRPGPIVGEMVHPYLSRRAGLEPVVYPHPSLEPILKRTLGVPLFQEQLLRIAMVAADFTGGQAEELRRALGFKRPDDAMRKIETKLREGLARNGIEGKTHETLIKYITSFALYGFPESHAASFALLAYASAYLKAHFPAAFYTALLNNQPMGFYHPATLVKDAQHHGQRVRCIDVQYSDWRCTVESDRSIRLGLMYARGLRQGTGLRIEAERRQCAYASLADFQRRVRPNRNEITVLARIGALNSLGMRRREALWQVEKAHRFAGPLLERLPEEKEPSPLHDMTRVERMISDYEGTGMTIGPHPMVLKRRALGKRGVLPAAQLHQVRTGRRVQVAGTVIVRQRPMTAKGFLFVSLEDETGIANVIVRPKMFDEHRLLLMSSSFLLVEGILQNQEDVISVRAERFEALDSFEIGVSSHDFG
ncbi:MAG: error-prone DNA polymerase [Acidobacteriota bacterium]|jgi:error-prone DNA polymerase